MDADDDDGDDLIIPPFLDVYGTPRTTRPDSALALALAVPPLVSLARSTSRGHVVVPGLRGSCGNGGREQKEARWGWKGRGRWWWWQEEQVMGGWSRRLYMFSSSSVCVLCRVSISDRCRCRCPRPRRHLRHGWVVAWKTTIFARNKIAETRWGDHRQ